MRDYYAILSRAVASLETNTAQSRALLFERARQVLLQEFNRDPVRWTDAKAAAELADFDAATDRIEFATARRTRAGSGERTDRRPMRDGPAPEVDNPPAETVRPRIARITALSMGALVGVVLCGAIVYFVRSDTTMTEPGDSSAVSISPGGTGKTLARPPPSNDYDLEPGVDGGSTDAGLPYYLRRQAVYYRTVYPTGMVIVDRSQRFLYLVQAQTRAIRYGIGVGGECAVNAGLYRIHGKSQWPEWSPSPALLKRRTYPARVSGGPGNPLGAYAIYLAEVKVPGIHGTNAPRSIGQASAIGCFRLVNDDIVDLEKRVPAGTGVVVLN